MRRPDPTRLAPRGLIRTFQQARVFPNLTALENLALAVPQSMLDAVRPRISTSERALAELDDEEREALGVEAADVTLDRLDQDGVHDMPLVMRLCDPVIALDRGSKIAEGSATQMQNDPRVLDAYLGD